MGELTSTVTWAPRTMNRRSWLAAFGGLMILGSTTPLLHAQEKNAEELKERQETLVTKDGFAIAATYWPSALKQDASVVVLLHGANGNQLDWATLPKKLQDEGYAVLAIDLRGHGQSKGTAASGESVDTKSKTKSKTTSKSSVDAGSLKAGDYQAMVLGDMEAVKAFVFSEHQQQKLNMNKMGIIGAGLGAAVALKYAAVDWAKKPHSDGPVGNQTPRGQDVRALVLLSPDSEIGGLPLPDAIKALRVPALQVAMMYAVGKKDKADKGQAKKLYDIAVTPIDKNEGRMYLQEYESPARGTALLTKNRTVETHIVNFLKKHLQEVRSEWRDRESRLGKKKKS